MNEEVKEKFAKWFARIVILAIIVVGLVMVWPAYLRGEALKRQKSELEGRIDRRQQDVAKVIEFQHRFRSDADFVEHIARQNRRVFPGELVFIFEDR